jgi:hypothetical protein
MPVPLEGWLEEERKLCGELSGEFLLRFDGCERWRPDAISEDGKDEFASGTSACIVLWVILRDVAKVEPSVHTPPVWTPVPKLPCPAAHLEDPPITDDRTSTFELEFGALTPK